MSYPTKRLMTLALLAQPLFVMGCVPPEEDGAIRESEAPALSSVNGLSSINGLSSLNGLSSINGLSSLNGLSSINGLSSTVGPMTSASGRATVSYLVKCALPAGHTLVKKDQYGTSYSFPGALGLAPSWETGAMTSDGIKWVSACMMAHVNTTGAHIPIYLTGPSPIGWGHSDSYPIQEGTFMGDIFASPPTAVYCGGRGYGSNVVAGRIGDDSGATKPYKRMNAISSDSSGYNRCDEICSRDPSGDGYVACAPIGDKGITVWRQLTGSPAFSFETDTQGFTTDNSKVPVTMALSTTEHLAGSKSLLATVNANGASSARIQIYNSTAAVPGKDMTVFVKVPSGTNWSYISAFVQDGPAKNYRWTNSGYNRSQMLPTEWASIVVKVPCDFAETGSKIGVEIWTTGSGTIKMYVDSFFFNN